jgi:hypothetical protein
LRQRLTNLQRGAHDVAFSVSFTDIEPFPKSEWCEGRFTSDRCVYLNYADVYQFLVELDDIANAGYPFPDGVSSAAARRAAISPLGVIGKNDDGTIKYAKALIHIYYDSAYQVKDGKDWLSEVLTVVQCGVSIPSSGLTWQDSTPLKSAISVLRPCLHFERTYFKLTSISPDALSLIGCVNNESVVARLSSIAFFPGTLLYNGSRIEAKCNINGVESYKVIESFLFSPLGWNAFFNPKTNLFEPVLLSTGDPFIPYPSRSFVNL